MPTYPITSKENSRRIRVAIRHVFLEIWDPIGVGNESPDEYDMYIGRMFELLMSNAPDSEIKKYLDWCVERMGMDSSRHSDADVIQALRTINLNETTQ